MGTTQQSAERSRVSDSYLDKALMLIANFENIIVEIKRRPARMSDAVCLPAASLIIGGAEQRFELLASHAWFKASHDRSDHRPSRRVSSLGFVFEPDGLIESSQPEFDVITAPKKEKPNDARIGEEQD
jgi:hypothetical protein